MSSEDAQGWVPATCLEAQTQDDPDEFTFPGGEGKIFLYSRSICCVTTVALVSR